MAFPQLGFPQVYGVDRASPPRDAGSEAGAAAGANPAALAPLLGVYANPWSAHRYGAFLPYSSADAAILNHMGSQYELKESPGAHGAHAAGLAVHAAPGFYPYGQFHYADPSRAKSATRETTSTLKAWLHEHKKNPYPTKGEKIMLAIVTKMTLTQVSTWFANARRRLKKENKVTWGRSADDVDSDEDDEEGARKNQSEREEEIDLETVDSDEEREEDKPDSPKAAARSDTDGEGAEDADAQPHALSNSSSTHSKPKIWSLAETATSPDSGHKATPIPTHPAFLSTSGIYTCQIGRLSAWPGGALLGVRSLMAAAAAAGTSAHYVTGAPPSPSPTGSLSPQHSSDRENVQSPKSPALPTRPSFPVIHSRSHHETAAQCPLKTVS